jgi:hypothetical protein
MGRMIYRIGMAALLSTLILWKGNTAMRAQEVSLPSFTLSPEMVVAPPPIEIFPALPALAERLGVQPVKEMPHGGGLYLRMLDGRIYDAFALINAFLDRVDAAERRR